MRRRDFFFFFLNAAHQIKSVHSVSKFTEALCGTCWWSPTAWKVWISVEVCSDADAEASHRMSQALLTPSVQRIFLPSKSGPYIPEPHVQKEGGVETEREDGERGRDGEVVRGRFSSVCVCVWLSTGKTHVKTLYMKSFNKIMTIPNIWHRCLEKQSLPIIA